MLFSIVLIFGVSSICHQESRSEQPLEKPKVPRAEEPQLPPNPEEIEAELNAVRNQLAKLRAKERELAERLAEAKATAPGSIKAEVTGVLRNKGKGDGYYLSLVNQNGETRIWLPPANNEVRDLLGSLHGQAVTVKGQMYQRHPARTIPYALPDEVSVGEFYILMFELVKPNPKP